MQVQCAVVDKVLAQGCLHLQESWLLQIWAASRKGSQIQKLTHSTRAAKDYPIQTSHLRMEPQVSVETFGPKPEYASPSRSAYMTGTRETERVQEPPIPAAASVYQTILYHIIPYYSIPYHTIPYYTIPYHTILYRTRNRDHKALNRSDACLALGSGAGGPHPEGLRTHGQGIGAVRSLLPTKGPCLGVHQGI